MNLDHVVCLFKILGSFSPILFRACRSAVKWQVVVRSNKSGVKTSISLLEGN